MKRIGIMQGRLSSPTDGKFQSFPKYTWREEFEKAQKAGLKSIEWIFESDEWEKNPISTNIGIEEINDLIKKTGTVVESVCADYFMDLPYFTASDIAKKEHREILSWLIEQTFLIGAKYLDLPFVDASKIESKAHFILVKEFIEMALKAALRRGILIALETNLGACDFSALLEQNNHPKLMANYDTGNSSGLGYDCIEELQAYGKRIKTVHIKDRLLNNGTKSLGTGSADFNSFFSELTKLNYNGPIILQAAREDDEVETAIKNRKFVEHYLDKYHV
jgi:hexulose-6-phosphate isomerase